MKENVNYKGPLLIFIVFVILIINRRERKNAININGVYSICQVIGVKGRKGALDVYIDFNYNNKKYTTIVSGVLDGGDIGKKFFIKFLPSDPMVVILDRSWKIPSCLQEVEPPIKGWSDIPKCDSLKTE